jgi:hypothetical protein
MTRGDEQEEGYLPDELVDDRLLLDAYRDGEEAFRRPDVSLAFRIATQ